MSVRGTARLQGDEWVRFFPGLSGAMGDRFERLHKHTVKMSYDDQTDPLRSWTFSDGVGLFIATHDLEYLTPMAQWQSRCTWSRGVPALLPRADWVGFVALDKGATQGRILAYGTWERVQQIVGHLMTPMDLYPERFRVDSFPDAEQLNAIGYPEWYDPADADVDIGPNRRYVKDTVMRVLLTLPGEVVGPYLGDAFSPWARAETATQATARKKCTKSKKNRQAKLESSAANAGTPFPDASTPRPTGADIL